MAVSLVVVAGVISALLQLGLLRRLLWGTCRTLLQLGLIGYVLTYVFAIDHPALVAGLIGVMCLVAARAAVKQVQHPPFRLYGLAVLSLTASTYLVGTMVCGLIIAADRWYTARVAIPIAGMILGNSLNGVALALDRFIAELRSQSPVVEQRLCLGYTPWEAARPHLRTALRTGMTPILNSLMIVGVVSLPGMMTGQILAGAEPLVAVRYQIVVMMMLAASVALGCLTLVGLSYRRCFTSDGALRPELLATTQR